MSSVRPILPAISDADRTPLICAPLELVQWQSEDDIHTLKKQTRKPKFKSSEMNKQNQRKMVLAVEKRKTPNEKLHLIPMLFGSYAHSHSSVDPGDNSRIRLWWPYQAAYPVCWNHHDSWYWLPRHISPVSVVIDYASSLLPWHCK